VVKPTVPVLLDKRTRKMVSNESSDILRMFNREFNEFSSKPELDLCPEELMPAIEAVNEVGEGEWEAGVTFPPSLFSWRFPSSPFPPSV
jgi:glutathionyl-hydroquinone reductase